MRALLPAMMAVLLTGFFLFAGWRGFGGARLARLKHLMGRDEKGQAAPAQAADLRFLPAGLARNLALLGLEAHQRDFLLAAVCAALPLIAIAVFVNPFLAAALAGGALAAGWALLNILAARQMKRMAALMPGFFERVRQLLGIGNSLSIAFGRAAQSSPPSLAEFFAPTLRRMGNGGGIAESIQQCAQDCGLHEMRLFAAAVAANMRFGGSLTHSLTNLVAYLRKRASIERELRASTAQIRTSAWVLGLLPILVASLIVTQNHEYARWFLTHPSGRRMLGYCILSQIVGALLMRRIVRTAF